MSLPDSLWLVGCGNMGGAMLRRWIDAGLEPVRVVVFRWWIALHRATHRPHWCWR